MENLRHIKDLLLKYKYRYLGGIFFIVLVDGLQLLLPWFLGKITDSLRDGQLEKGQLVYYAFGIAAISVGIAMFRFMWRYLLLGSARKIETAIRLRFYAHLQKLSQSYYSKTKTGDLMAHATNDITQVQTALGQGIAFAVDSALVPVFAAIMMFKTAGAGLTLACFSPLVLLTAVASISIRIMNENIQKIQEAFSLLTEKARENISGIRVIKSFVQEEKEIEKFRRENMHNRDTNLRYAKTFRLFFSLVLAISSLTSAIALLYGGILVINGSISLGDFVAFNSYLLLLAWPLAALGWLANIFQRGIVSLKRINEILDEMPEIEDGPDVLPVAGIKGRIQFKNLTFTYPGSEKPTLKNISFDLDEGKTLAIVGRTGSGKTTLTNLITRLYNVNEGCLLIDGMDISRIPLSALRDNIGLVPQDNFLFSASIKDNIDFFQGKDMESIENAAGLAKVYDNIMAFPEGFNTKVGERGVTLSGGQKQRVTIARALVKDPSILILDDCLSAVDTQTEEEILKGLREVMKQRTSIIVSHRISTIKDADEIIVLEDGEIAERGTHESLLSLQGTYFELYEKQLLADQITQEE